MSSDEEKAVIGGMVMEHGEVKRRLVALEEEAKKAGRVLGHIEVALRTPSGAAKSKQFEANITEMPTPETVKGLIDEIREKTKRKDELQAALKQYGIEV
jgi:hypothetical protein